MAQSLSNGYCNLPLGQGRCPHANTCLNCANFKTEQSYLPKHEKQLLEKIIYTLNGIKDV